jgi:hypothetical protein
VASTLDLFPNGAVGFIDWLGRIAPITGKEEKENKKKCGDRTGEDKKDWPHIRVLSKCCDCGVNDVNHKRDRKQREPAPSTVQSDRHEDLRGEVNSEGQSPTSQ